MELARKSCLSKLFLKLLFGTVVQKLSCEAISRGKTSIGIPGFCNALLSNGRGLGRSLSYVGRNEIRLFMMLRGSVVHKSPFAAASEAFAWSRRAKVAFQSYLAAFAWNCRAKIASRAFACKCKSGLAKLFPKGLRGTVVQKLRCEAVPQPLAWSCLAKAAFRNYFASFCMISSCKDVQGLFLEAIS